MHTHQSAWSQAPSESYAFLGAGQQPPRGWAFPSPNLRIRFKKLSREILLKTFHSSSSFIFRSRMPRLPRRPWSFDTFTTQNFCATLGEGSLVTINEFMGARPVPPVRTLHVAQLVATFCCITLPKPSSSRGEGDHTPGASSSFLCLQPPWLHKSSRSAPR